VTDPTCRGQPWYNPLRVRESRLSWRLDASGPPSGGTVWIRSPGACSRAATLRESEDCACRGLDACCNPFGGGRMAPKPGLISGAATPRAKSAVATSEDGSRPSRGTGSPDVSACLGRASLWRCGETVPLERVGRVKTVQIASVEPGLFREVGCKRCAERQRTVQASLGRHGDRGCAATAPATPLCGTAPFRGVSPQSVAVRWKTCMGPGPTRNQVVMPPMPCRPQGRVRKTACRVPAATLEARRTV